MPKLTDTYARAYDCCDRILTELGRFPTIDLIRERIGVNSPTTIKKAMNEWTQHFAEQHFDKLHRPDIPVTLIHSVEQVWKLAVLEAEKAYLDKEKAYQHSLAENQAVLVQQQQEQQTLKAILRDTDTALAQAGQYSQALQQQLNGQQQENAELQEKVAANEKQLQEQHKLMQEQALRWQQQQEQEQEWFARRLSEEKQFLEEKWQEKIQRQAQQIAVLSESETSLRQVCASLRQEQQRLQQVLSKLDQGQNKPHRFKIKSVPSNKPSR